MDADYLDRFGGIGRLYGASALERIRDAHVMVIGIGGVGSWTAEALARTGIGKLTMVDLDEICVTNVNRQLHALDGQIGKTKAGVMAERLKLIHPQCEILCREEFFTAGNAERLLEDGPDVVVDAIDTLDHKVHLIATCRDKEIPVVTCGGAGGKRSVSGVQVRDLALATNDRLLKLLRKRLRNECDFPREENVSFGVPAVYSVENAVFPGQDGEICERSESGANMRLNCDSGFGSASFVTGTFGFAAAGEAVRLVAESV